MGRRKERLQERGCTKDERKCDKSNTEPKAGVELLGGLHAIEVFKGMNLEPAHAKKHGSCKAQQKEKKHTHNTLLFVVFIICFSLSVVNRKG